MLTPVTPISRTISILKVHSRLKAFCLSVVFFFVVCIEWIIRSTCYKVLCHRHFMFVNKIYIKNLSGGVAQWLGCWISDQGVPGSNHGRCTFRCGLEPCLELVDGRLTWTDCDEAGYYVVPNVFSPRDLVSRPDNMDESVPHTYILKGQCGILIR